MSREAAAAFVVTQQELGCGAWSGGCRVQRWSGNKHTGFRTPLPYPTPLLQPPSPLTR